MYLRKEIYGWMKFPFLNTDKMAGNMEVSERKGWSRMLDGGGGFTGLWSAKQFQSPISDTFIDYYQQDEPLCQ